MSTPANRSRKGCWTCRDRHKKCDEEQPECGICQRSGRVCAGYGVRLAWATDKVEQHTNDVTGILKPGPGRRRRVGQVPERGSMIQKPQALRVSHDVEDALFEAFKSHGIYTLVGNTTKADTLVTESIALCSSCEALRYVTIAFQASLDAKHLAASYLQTALELYQANLNNPSRLGQDSTLLTGVFLCSFGIVSLSRWTFHLAGLEAILTHRGAIDKARRTFFTDHLVEVIGLLDFPTATIGSIHSKQRTWLRYTAPHACTGIEPVSHLPRSLLTIFAQVESMGPSFEANLLAWPSESAEYYAQYHLWEAWRFAFILNHRALHDPNAEYPDTEIMTMRIHASIEAALALSPPSLKLDMEHEVLYPLFTSSLLTLIGTTDRAYVRTRWQGVISKGQYPGAQAALDVLEQVWLRGTRENFRRYQSLQSADEVAHDMGIELHLF